MPQRRLFASPALPLATACLLVTLSGCASGLGGVDRRIEALVAKRADALGTGTPNPAPRTATEPAERDDADHSTDPQTANPETEELSYTQADPQRDVADRLKQLTEPEIAGDNSTMLDLTAVFRLAQESAREYLTAEEEYVLAAVRLLIERHLWSPRFFNDTSAQIGADGDGGSFDTALSIVNELRATQRLPYGGSVEASWVARATQQLRDEVSDQYQQSSELVLSGNIPLLRGAGRVAREDLIQAERDLVYAARTFERFRRSFLVSIAADYFDLLNLRAQIVNQERQLQSLQTVETRTQELVDAGRESAFRTKIVSNQVLNARANQASLRERYVLALDRFKVRLGLDVNTPIAVAELEFALPDPSFELDAVAQTALEYRLDLQTRWDRLQDSKRGVANARNAVLPDLDLTGRVALPTDPTEGAAGVAFDPDYTDWNVGVSFGLPLDREIERLRVRQSTINFERAKRDYERRRDDIVVEARSAARSVELARFRLQLAELQVEINESRLQEQQLKADEVDPQTIVDTENELLDSQNARDQAETDLRNAILDYLLETGQLRVTPEGSLDPLPGMTIESSADQGG